MLRATLSLALAATLIVGAPWTMLFAAPTDASGNASFALPFDPATLPVPVTTIYAQAASPASTFVLCVCLCDLGR